MGIRRGQPKISFFVKFIIAYKVKQYQKRWNLTARAAWLQFSETKTFECLMKEHFKNKVYTGHWVNNILENKNVRETFYKNHIREIIKQFPSLKIYTPKEYKDYLAIIKARKTIGLGSLKKYASKARSR
jgi:hypothetical protein